MIDRNSPYFRQVELLVRVMLFLEEEPCFAVKGGTAINLFVRDLPRLSVDIDLVYVPIQDRESSLGAMDAALRRMAVRMEEVLKGLRVTLSFLHGTETVNKLMLELNGVRVKVEASPVLRGLLEPPVWSTVREGVAERIGYAEAWVAAVPDLFGGKICAALDRQHPRDLYDLRGLMSEGLLNAEVFQAVLVYMISHPRPIAELLSPNRKDLSGVFAREFAGMTLEPCTLKELEDAREELIAWVNGSLQEEHKRFLLSFKQGEPEWESLGVSAAKELPAVQWKLSSIRAMSARKRNLALQKLDQVLRGER
ncbi:MAG: nucleotidyl transferase AbiEii/AbiGii toxin family protein [Verrucomicrobia bacterium]|nr:nucleotidyl transferase AbiEii/AbiGii toxin family protein [Verrucomicrobiota bacterium]MCH8510776.1 nucleotidyl transferase AbiEii/AbiGii toxin family protein [Kiritimatiellia bacterium]